MNSNLFFQLLDFFSLKIGDKIVPIPYRRNELGKFQMVGPEFQGKSAPEVIQAKLIELSVGEGFDLEKASVEEIRTFMRNHKLGIDCSGFIYRMLNGYIKKVKGKDLQDVGFEHVGRTNIAKLTSDEFAVKIKNLADAQPGDILKFESGEDVLHGVLILDNDGGTITYAHSSGETIPDGVHSGKIRNHHFPKDLDIFHYDEEKGDGLYRLKALL